MNNFSKRGARFPVEEALPRLRQAISQGNRCLLIAPPGAGKTTLVPPALLAEPWLGGQKIIMLEPRRIAARRAAEYMARQMGERCGETVGYRVRMESVSGPNTRIEVVTEGVLTRMLQADAELPGTGLVIFDEYHERSIHADTGLAFTLDVQKNLRPGLKILIMSATPDKEKLLALLGDIPVVTSEGTMYPVTTHYLAHPADKRLEIITAEAVLRALHRDTGDILVFLPGKAEIKRTRHLLDEKMTRDDCVVHELHGSAPREEQDAALSPAPPGIRKIILATSIAETSVTIEGIRVVIDSGVSRVSDFNLRRGMPGLITIPVSRATAEQRRGRAGRLQEGTCYRLWTRQDELQHPAHTTPEILSTDLTPLALELAQWGAPGAEGLLFPDPPPADTMNYARTTLQMLGAVDSAGRMTESGKHMNRLPVHPRLAAMLLRAKEAGTAPEACLLAAMLEENNHGGKNARFDLQEEFDALVNGFSARRPAGAALQEYAQKLMRAVGINKREYRAVSAGRLLAVAYPERIAANQGGRKFRLVQGMVVTIPEESRLQDEPFLVIAEADGAQATGKAFSAATISKDEILELFSGIIEQDEQVSWENNAVRGKRRLQLGTLAVQEKEFKPSAEQAAACIAKMVKEEGLSFLPLRDDAARLIERSEWVRANVPGKTGGGWPVLDTATLQETMHDWLTPYLAGVYRKKELDDLDMVQILRSLFNYQQLSALDALAPDTLAVPGGSHISIRYNEGEKPVLAVRLQELFGVTDTPAVGGGSVPLLIHLLSPAHRPLAITQDLRSFWKNTYPEILKQMRVKYPKHVWPDDPLTADPTNKTKRYRK